MKTEVWMGETVLLRENASDEDLSWLKQKKFLKVMDPSAKQVLRAVHLAGENMVEKFAGGDCGVVLSLAGLDSGLNDWEEARQRTEETLGKKNCSVAEIGKQLPPLALLTRLPNTIAGHVSREFGTTGPCCTLGGTGGFGLDAVLQGIRWISSGECRRVIVARVEKGTTVAVILQGEPAGNSARKILSWSAADTEPPANAEGLQKLLEIGDWMGWKKSRVLWAEQHGAIMRMDWEPL